MTEIENPAKTSREGGQKSKEGFTVPRQELLRQFPFNSEYILDGVQFSLRRPLGKIGHHPTFGELSVLDAEEGMFQLYSSSGLWDLEAVSGQQKKLVLDLLRRQFICVAEVLTFHDTTEADDVRGVVRLYLVFLRQGFTLPKESLEVQIPAKVISGIEARRFPASLEEIIKNFSLSLGDYGEYFAYSDRYYPENGEGGEVNDPTGASGEQDSNAARSDSGATVQGQDASGSDIPEVTGNALVAQNAAEAAGEKTMQSSEPDIRHTAGSLATRSFLWGKGFRLFGKKYDFDITFAGQEDEEYLIVKSVVFAHRKRPVMSLVRAKLTFSKNEVSRAAQLLKETFKETADYANVWQRYSDMEGDFLLRKARKVGVLHLNTDQNLVGGKRKVSVEGDRLNWLNQGDQLISIEEEPPYLADLSMTWAAYRESNSFLPDQKPAVSVEIAGINKSEGSLTLDSWQGLDGKFVLSLKGQETIIDRREKARNSLTSGETHNPVIAAIITHELKNGGSSAVAPPPFKGKREALSGHVKQKIFPKNDPTMTQRSAIEIALNTPDIAIIQGPPGTGKTTVITAIMERLNELSNKDGKAQGRVLITSLQHDAVKNVIERLRINSLPTIKFGTKQDKEDNDLEGSVLDWCDDVISKLQDKNPQFRESRELERLTDLYHNYCLTPSDENAVNFLEYARSETVDAERLRRIDSILFELRPADDSREESILNKVRRLRTGKGAFADDGRENARDLYAALEGIMNPDSAVGHDILSCLEEAARSHVPEPEMLERLKKVKEKLLERIVPRPSYRASQARGDITALYSEIREEIRKPLRGPDDEINNVLFEFLRELESNPSGVSKAVQAYSYAYAATALQSDGKEIREVKGLGKGKKDMLPDFDTVIVDEAARVNPCDLMIPLAQAKERVILVGDHRQLPHMYDEEVFQALQEAGEEINEGDIKSSMFEHLINKARELTKRDGIPRFITLDEQYRMHPLLGKFASDEFYEPYQESFKSPLPAENFRQSFFDKPLVWIDIPYSQNSRCVRVGTSWRRDREAEVIADRIKSFVELDKGAKKETTFGVISFYSAQVELIKRKLAGALGEEQSEKRVRVGSVDAFQGREFDVIFLSTVRSSCKPDIKEPRLLEHTGKFPDDEQGKRDKAAFDKIGRSNYGFLTSENRLCVALTRQKKLLIVVGDSNIFIGPEFQIIAERFVPAMKHLYELCSKEGEVISA